MKKIVALILCVLTVISFSSCSDKKEETPVQQEETPPPKVEISYPYNAEYVEMGVPLAEYYRDGGVERCVWDIEYFDNGLFVASGDYDKNRGPVYMTHYSFDDEKWLFDTALPDEQIERFFIIDNKLYAAGCDPRTSWDYGNFYYFEGGRWQTNNTVPGGIHNFDIVQFQGKFYLGLGVLKGDAPVKVSDDKQNWTSVYLYKDGEIRETYDAEFIRVYDFFVYNDELYAYFYTKYDDQNYNEIYRLEGDKFVYHSDMISNIWTSKTAFATINQKLEFKDNMLFTTGYFYKTTDMKTAERINVGDTTAVTDMKVIDDTLYILCNEKIIKEDSSEEFRVSVKRSTDGAEFEEMFFFNYPVRALSFTYGNEHFYLGMGYGVRAQQRYDENGAVLAVKNPL